MKRSNISGDLNTTSGSENWLPENDGHGITKLRIAARAGVRRPNLRRHGYASAKQQRRSGGNIGIPAQRNGGATVARSAGGSGF